jgi:putative hemolysin
MKNRSLSAAVSMVAIGVAGLLTACPSQETPMTQDCAAWAEEDGAPNPDKICEKMREAGYDITDVTRDEYEESLDEYTRSLLEGMSQLK